MARYFVLLLFCWTVGLNSQEIKKVEPPFWWTEMKNQELQLMIYGDNIADLTPEIIDKSVALLGVQKTENPNYLFLNLSLKNAEVGTFGIELKKGKKSKLSLSYELKERRKGSASRKGFDSSDLIYLIMPDRFANGNPTNDSHPSLLEKADRSFDGGRHGGDIQGIIDHLDYLDELGVTAIWSTPLLEDNDQKYSYHTYAQSDVYRIDPRYGTNEDYKRLAEEIHKRNMKLVMDYVTNHWGMQHWMMQDLPTYNWIHQWPGYKNTSYRMTTQYDPNASKEDYKLCMDGWFVSTMPDLNQSNELLLNYITQNAIWWIEYADLDGFRVDTYSYNDKEGIAKWTKAITNEYPNFNIVGEVWLHNQAQIAYWQKDSKIGALQNYNTGLPSVMDFTLHDALMTVFDEEKSSWDKGMIKVYENFVNDFLYPNINNLLVFAENHDTARINHLFKGDFQKYQLAMTLIATVRGIPQIYYGSEIGMQGDKNKGDADIRRDFPGGWEGDTNNAFLASERTPKQHRYFDFTSKLFQWRKRKPVIHYGKMMHYVPENNVYVYFRYDENDTVMVIINNNPKAQEITLGRFKERINGFIKGKDILTAKEIVLKDSLKIEGKTSIILELE